MAPVEAFQASVQWLAKWTLLMMVYVFWDTLCGLAATRVWLVLRDWLQFPKDSFAWSFEQVSINWGFLSGSTRIEVRKFRWGNPRGFNKYDYFLEVKRATIVVDVASLYRHLVAKTEDAVGVEYVETEGVTTNLERRRGELNLWACLGLGEDEARRRLEEAKGQFGDRLEEDFDPDDFEETDEIEEEEAPVSRHWGLKFLGAYAVQRVTVRKVKARVEAFAVARDASDAALKIERFELSKKQLRASKRRRSMYIDELVWKTSLAVAKKATAVNTLGLASAGLNVAQDRARAATKSITQTIAGAALNLTHATALRGASEGGGDGGQKGVVVVVHEAKHCGTESLPKPACYVKLWQKDGAKAKSTVAPNSRNPNFNDHTLTLRPFDREKPLKVQMFAKRTLASDVPIAPKLDVQLSDDGTSLSDWFYFRAENAEPETEENPNKIPAVRLTLRFAPSS